MKKILSLSILLAFTAVLCIAQQQKIPFERYGVPEGLPEEVAITPLQDNQGFIWFGTQNGLVKYDGYHFKVFRVTGDKTDLTNYKLRNLLGGLLKARDGKIWIGEFSGDAAISSFDPVTEKFRTFYPAGNGAKSDGTDINVFLFEDAGGNIWFKNGSLLNGKYYICRLNPATGIIKRFPVTDINAESRYLNKFGTVESSGIIWTLDDKKNLRQLNRQKDIFEIIVPAGKNLTQSGISDTIRQLAKGGENRLLLTGSHGLYIMNSRTRKVINSYTHQPGNDAGIADSVSYALEDVKGQYWLSHANGSISLIAIRLNQIQIFRYGSNAFPFHKG